MADGVILGLSNRQKQYFWQRTDREAISSCPIITETTARFRYWGPRSRPPVVHISKTVTRFRRPRHDPRRLAIKTHRDAPDDACCGGYERQMNLAGAQRRVRWLVSVERNCFGFSRGTESVPRLGDGFRRRQFLGSGTVIFPGTPGSSGRAVRLDLC